MLPAYQGGSIANLPTSILDGMGLAPDVSLLPPVLPELLPASVFAESRVVILLVIDGLGAVAMRGHAAVGDVPGLASAPLQSTLTSVFPSTTAAATTSLQYGVAPGTHGMAGYTLYLPEIGEVFNMITWRVAGKRGSPIEGPQPEAFLTVPHLFTLLERGGIDTVIVSNQAFAASPLTRAQASGVRYRGYRTLAEFTGRLVREVEREGRRFVFGYWDGYDGLSHTWGAASEVVRLELRLIDQALREGLLEPLTRLAEQVTLLVTADHGHVPMPRDQRLDLSQLDGLLPALARRPSGEPRQLGLALRDGTAFDASKFADFADGAAVVVDADAARAAGLYGPPPLHGQLATRTGDYLLLARGEGAMNFPGGISGSVGGHGSLTEREMLAPLLVWRFP